MSDEIETQVDGEGVDLPEFDEPAVNTPDEAQPPVPAAEGQIEHNSQSETHTAAELEAVFDVPVNISAVLGKTHMEVSSLLRLAKGAVIELDRKVGEAIDIYVNNRLVARGEVVLVEERLGVTMTEIIQADK